MKEKSDCIVLTPYVANEESCTVRLERVEAAEIGKFEGVAHSGHGIHDGLVVRSAANFERLKNDDELTSICLRVRVHNASKNLDEQVKLLRDFFLQPQVIGSLLFQQVRCLKFLFDDSFDKEQTASYLHSFFEFLLPKFPSDYGNFFKRLMKLMQRRFTHIRLLDVIIMHDSAKQSDDGDDIVCQDMQICGDVEPATVGKVQELLEHAFPNGMTPEEIAATLHCPTETIVNFLETLYEKGVVVQVESNQWIRVDKDADFQKAIGKQMPKVSRTDRPTVAIVTSLYVEKLAVDAVLENKKTFVRYKTDGESNVYTLGNIGNCRVVATKLSSVGQSRAQEISSGSITTRLLGGFPEIEHVLIVGVGGMPPRQQNVEHGTCLGDVVVSMPANKNNRFAYIACNTLKKNRYTKLVESYGVKTWIQHDDVIEKIIKQVRSACDEHPFPWKQYYEEGLNALGEIANQDHFEFTRPSGESDPNENSVDNPRLHLGPVAASRIVCMHQNLKANFANQFGILAFDAGFDAVVESVFGNRIGSWILIRGLADSTDGTKQKKWQAYAALQAAAVAKLIISQLP